MWTEEMKDKLESDPILVYRPGETDIVWKFSGMLRDFWMRELNNVEFVF